jgi:hypothetical protein
MPVETTKESVPESSAARETQRRSVPTRPSGQTLKHSHISEDEMQQALLRSGYLLEHRIETTLRRKGWYVDGSHAYRDSDTGKSRELDLYAINFWDISTRTKTHRNDRVCIELVIECVNNSQPLAFLTKRDPFAGGENALSRSSLYVTPLLFGPNALSTIYAVFSAWTIINITASVELPLSFVPSPARKTSQNGWPLTKTSTSTYFQP